jgi:MerR family transcriptional regulator, copper efflux regulator
MKVYAVAVIAGYTIKDVAERSGFTAATLRYYEEIGLLPQSIRTAAGYRVYHDDTLERLAFIARAKQLGCSLDEIADLSIAWEGGRCGPVQDRLRTVVADKLADAQQQIVELMTLSAELQRAAATLELHRPDGPCDDQCGCVTDAAPAMVSPQPVALGTKPASSEAIVCTLGAESMQGRLREWQALLVHVMRRDEINAGIRVTFDPSTPLHELMRLAAAEQGCCQFFKLAITIDNRGVALEVRAPDDALPIVHSLFGTAA